MALATDAVGIVERRAGLAGQVVVAEFHAPSTRNALAPAMLDELAAILSRDDDDVSAIVLRGNGTNFCAGVDGRAVRRALQTGWTGAFENLVDATHRVLRALLSCPVPVVAAVDGRAAGAGVTFALLADTRVVTTRGSLRPGHLAAGAPLDGGCSYALAWALGPARAMSILVEDRALSGDDLHTWGLAGAPVAPDDLEDRAVRTAEQAGAGDRAALRAARRLLRKANLAEFETQWSAELEHLRAFVESGRLQDNLDRYWERKGGGR